MDSSFSLCFCISTHLYSIGLTHSGVWTVVLTNSHLIKEVNSVWIASFSLRPIIPQSTFTHDLQMMIIYNVNNYYKCKHIIDDNFFIFNHFEGCVISWVCASLRGQFVWSHWGSNAYSICYLSIINKNVIVFSFKCLFKALLFIKSLFIVRVSSLFVDHLLFWSNLFF